MNALKDIQGVIFDYGGTIDTNKMCISDRVLVLASCKKGQKNLFTPTSSGRHYEVLVVVNKPVWDLSVSYTHIDVYKRQDKAYKL